MSWIDIDKVPNLAGKWCVFDSFDSGICLKKNSLSSERNTDM